MRQIEAAQVRSCTEAVDQVSPKDDRVYGHWVHCAIANTQCLSMQWERLSAVHALAIRVVHGSGRF